MALVPALLSLNERLQGGGLHNGNARQSCQPSSDSLSATCTCLPADSLAIANLDCQPVEIRCRTFCWLRQTVRILAVLHAPDLRS